MSETVSRMIMRWKAEAAAECPRLLDFLSTETTCWLFGRVAEESLDLRRWMAENVAALRERMTGLEKTLRDVSLERDQLKVKLTEAERERDNWHQMTVDQEQRLSGSIRACNAAIMGQEALRLELRGAQEQLKEQGHRVISLLASLDAYRGGRAEESLEGLRCALAEARIATGKLREACATEAEKAKARIEELQEANESLRRLLVEVKAEAWDMTYGARHQG